MNYTNFVQSVQH